MRMMHAEASDHEEMRADLCSQIRDLLGRLTRSNVQPDSPVVALQSVECGYNECSEPRFDVLDIDGTIVDDVQKVQIRCSVMNGLIDRVVEHDFGVLGEIEGNDDAMAIRRHGISRVHRSCPCGVLR